MLKGRDYIPVLEGSVADEPASGFVTRFAPSPTGYLHIGHAYAALFACESARQSGGSFRLRMEDLDRQRSRPEFEAAIIEDLAWLGLVADPPVVRQSDRMAAYAAALAELRARDLVYPCFCTRKSIRLEVEDAGRAPHGAAAAEARYPGTCRDLPDLVARARIERGEAFAWRLDVGRAQERAGRLHWYDIRAGWNEAQPEQLGDVVLARKDVPTSYHLAVVVDDAAQGVTLVTRGEDLFQATHIHRLLQALLGLPIPRYYHHNLIADSRGERLAKRNRAITLRHLRDSRRTPDDVWRMIGLAAPAVLQAG